jgi:hypothetical protein
MKVVALLSWYDESPAFLAACVAGIARGCTHLVAVDGPYFHYPAAHETPVSPLDQHTVIANTALASGLALTTHAPGVWRGGEVEKRDTMFALAAHVCEPGDWCWVLDADEVVTHLPGDWPHVLGWTPDAVAAPLLYQPQHNTEGIAVDVLVDPTSRTHPATLFRWPDEDRIRIVGSHATYRVPGWTLRGADDADHPRAAATILDSVEVEHRRLSRAVYRREAQHAYYERRDHLGLEESLFA